MVRLKEEGGVTAKIIDLGLAKTVDESASEAGISSPGAFAGTPEFASPEQFAGVDIRSDLYSLGVTLWVMASGQTPFLGPSAEVMYQHQHAPLPLERLKDVPQPVVVLIKKLLEKDPAKRFQTPDELLKAIPTITGVIDAPLQSLVGACSRRRGKGRVGRKTPGDANRAAWRSAGYPSGTGGAFRRSRRASHSGRRRGLVRPRRTPNKTGVSCASFSRGAVRRFEQAKSDIQQAMLLSPRDPAMGQWFNLRADTELGLGRFDEALEDAKKAIEGGHRVFYTYLNLAAAHAFKGEMDEAKAATAEARRLKPDLSIKWLLKHKPVLQFAFDGLRKAGLPEE